MSAKKISFAVLFLFLGISFVSGASTAYAANKSSASALTYQNVASLANDAEYSVLHNRFYKKLVSEDLKDVEQHKILYLLEELRQSPHKFERNGKIYPAAKAASHLRMKYAHERSRIETAEQFIDLLASKSSSSGRDYHVMTKGGTVFPAALVLHNELDRINQLMSQQHQH